MHGVGGGTLCHVTEDGGGRTHLQESRPRFNTLLSFADLSFPCAWMLAIYSCLSVHYSNTIDSDVEKFIEKIISVQVQNI